VATYKEFLLWEEADRDVIKVKRLYIDIAEDVVAGLLLSQIVYWHLPSKIGKTKLRVKKEGKFWLAKGRDAWWEECRITPRQFDRAIEILIEKGIVQKYLFRWNGSPTVHIHLVVDRLMDHVNATMEKYQDDEFRFNGFVKSNLPDGEIQLDETVKTITETTTKTTEVQNTGEEHAESSNANQEDIKKQIKYVGDPVSLEFGDDLVMESDVHVGHLLKESKHLTKTQEKFGNKNIPVLIENWEKREGRSKRSEKTGMKVKTSPKNSNAIVSHFNELFKEFFGGTPPIIIGKDNALLKKMISHYGFEYVDTMMVWMFKNWGKFVREKKITGIPSIGILWGYKLYFQEKVSKLMESSDDSEW